MKTIVLKQPTPPEEPVPTEVLATAIVSISEGIKKLRGGRLNDKALILLIKASVKKPKVSVAQVKAVLDGIEGLQVTYMRK